MAIPGGRAIVHANRAFLGGAVRYLTEQGIRQFLDLGTGLPTQNNVHQVAHGIDPKATVVYVDNDPIVLAHGRALLVDDVTTTVVEADLRDPAAVLTHPETQKLIDFSRPVGVLFVSVLHFVPDDAEAGRIVAAYADAVAPGSYLVLSHLADHPTVTANKSAYEETVARLRGRTHAAIERLFDGFTLVPPGVVDVRAWPEPDTDAQDGLILCGVGRKS